MSGFLGPKPCRITLEVPDKDDSNKVNIWEFDDCYVDLIHETIAREDFPPYSRHDHESSNFMMTTTIRTSMALRAKIYGQAKVSIKNVNNNIKKTSEVSGPIRIVRLPDILEEFD